MTHAETFRRSVLVFIETIRRFRQSMGLSPKIRLGVVIYAPAVCYEDLMLIKNEGMVNFVLNTTLNVHYHDEIPRDTFALPLWGKTQALIHIDPEEMPKFSGILQKQLIVNERERAKVKNLVDAPGFLTSAPVEVIDTHRRTLEDLESARKGLLAMSKIANLTLWSALDYKCYNPTEEQPC